MGYLLASHVFLCFHGDTAIFLDLRQDRYLALEAKAAHRCIESTGDENSPVARMLLARGLLTSDRRAGRENSACEVRTPARELPSVAHAFETESTVQCRDALRFLRAAFTARALLHFRSLEQVVARVKRRALSARPLHDQLGFEAVGACVAAYQRLRPFVFSARDACLFESLALIEFLARQGQYPQWVVGVKTAPFVAHCWVQQDDVVFNDSVEHIRAFTPIMAV